MSGTITMKKLWDDWQVRTFQDSIICAKFVGTNRYRQRVSLPARLGLNERIELGISLNPSPSQSQTVAADRDCLDA